MLQLQGHVPLLQGSSSGRVQTCDAPGCLWLVAFVTQVDQELAQFLEQRPEYCRCSLAPRSFTCARYGITKKFLEVK